MNFSALSLLFTLPGDVQILGDLALTVSSVLSGTNPLITLTCISTGGPATTVTWTRDSTTVTQGTVTVLDDPVTAQYTHTLTVSIEGYYTCTVSNNKPSTASASVTLRGIATYKIYRETLFQHIRKLRFRYNPL